MGYGTVGSGVVKVINDNNAIVSKNAGDTLQVKRILDLRDFPGDPYENLLTHDFNDILNDEEISIVVETMGGVGVAYKFTKACLEAGKSVCTSNKELVAEHGRELMLTALEHGANYMFEASCGGGIPIIRSLVSAVTGDEIEKVSGIINGTTNYILTQMHDNGTDFDEALAEAQRLGFAELHPEADIEGFDPCRKIAILSSIAYDKAVDYKDIHCEGITKISAEDFVYAEKFGMAIKLIASSEKVKNGYACLVAPRMVDETSPLAGVNGAFNAVFIRGNMLGDAMFYGSGAGSLPTASAVVGDVVACAKYAGRNEMKIWSEEKLDLVPYDKIRSTFLVRVKGKPDDYIDRIEEVFGSVTPVTLAEFEDEEYAFVVSDMTEGAFNERYPKLKKAISFIRMEVAK